MFVPERLKTIRLAKGLTQKQLADKCGINDANLRKYENGKQNPKIETLKKIAKALDISPLFFDNDVLDDNEFIYAIKENNCGSTKLEEYGEIIEDLHHIYKSGLNPEDYGYKVNSKPNRIKLLGIDPNFLYDKANELNNNNEITTEIDYKETNKAIQLKNDTISKYDSLNALGQQKANEYITDLSEQEKYTKPDEE